MNRIATVFLSSCIALGAASAMAQAGGGGGSGSGGGGGPGLNSPDSGAMQQKPGTSTGPTSGTTAPTTANQGGRASGGNMASPRSSDTNGMDAGKSRDMKSNKGAGNNTQGTGQGQTPSPQ